jgi:hypothetical protein
MTTNVSIHNTPGHWKVKVFRRDIKTGAETELHTVAPGEMIHHAALWDDAELVLREVPIEAPAP